MSVTENTGGTQLAVISTEHVLATIIGDPETYFQLRVDISVLADGDELELRLKIAARSGESRKTEWIATYAHDQGDDAELAVSPPVPVPFEIEFTLLQVAGVGRSFVWSVMQSP